MHAALVERDREEQTGCEGEEDDRRGEGERPAEDRDERLANERIVQDLAEVAESGVCLPAWLELFLARDERAEAVVVEDLAVAQPDKLVVFRVEAQRRLQLDRDPRSLRLDRRVSGRRHLVRP